MPIGTNITANIKAALAPYPSNITTFLIAHCQDDAAGPWIASITVLQNASALVRTTLNALATTVPNQPSARGIMATSGYNAPVVGFFSDILAVPGRTAALANLTLLDNALAAALAVATPLVGIDSRYDDFQVWLNNRPTSAPAGSKQLWWNSNVLTRTP